MTAHCISFIILAGQCTWPGSEWACPYSSPNPLSRSERYQHRNQENQMIKARKERVRELIRSLESV